jgi:hypothetical protein
MPFPAFSSPCTVLAQKMYRDQKAIHQLRLPFVPPKSPATQHCLDKLPWWQGWHEPSMPGADLNLARAIAAQAGSSVGQVGAGADVAAVAAAAAQMVAAAAAVDSAANGAGGQATADAASSVI